MQPTSILFSFLLIFSFFSQSVSAQTKSTAIDGYWKGEGYELYLQHGSFLLQTKDQPALIGTFQCEKECLVLSEGSGKPMFRVILHGNLLVLMGAEMEIKLLADKNNAARNIYLGMINEIQMSRLQESVSSQLPDSNY